jgi:hypothetical protein
MTSVRALAMIVGMSAATLGALALIPQTCSPSERLRAPPSR